VVAGASLLLKLFQPQLTQMAFGSLSVFFVVLVAVCVAIGVPIAFAFGIATMSYPGELASLVLITIGR
jgi:hypothetical protein